MRVKRREAERLALRYEDMVLRFNGQMSLLDEG